MTSIFLALKVEEIRKTVDQLCDSVAEGQRAVVPAEDVLECEPRLLEGIGFDLVVFQAFRALEGLAGHMEVRCSRFGLGFRV